MVSNVFNYINIPSNIPLQQSSSPQRLSKKENASLESIQKTFKLHVISLTQNSGKKSDQAILEALKKFPARITDNSYSIIQAFGFNTDMSIDEYPPLSPDIRDGGKCLGGVASLIAEYHKSGDILALAEKYRSGIPLEGILSFEIYSTCNGSFLTSQLEKELVTILSPSLKPTFKSQLKNLFNQERNAKDPETNYILEPVLSQEEETLLAAAEAFINQGLDINKHDFVGYATAHYEKTYNESIPLKYQAVLQKSSLVGKINSNDYFQGTELILYSLNNILLRIHDLKIEKTLVFNSSADAVINAVSDLMPGTYCLDFPIYDHHAELKGLHTTALIVDTNGTTYFYDPNTCIGETKNRSATIKHVFKYYNGYGNDLFSRVNNFYTKQANQPLSGLKKMFDLYKIIPIVNA